MDDRNNRLWILQISTLAFSLALCFLLASRLLREAPISHESRIVPIPVENVSGISFDGEKLWITADGEGTISRVDPATGRLELQWSVEFAETGGSAWDGEALWQLAYLERKIYRIDVATGEVLETLPAPGGGICAGMTFDGRHLWLGNPDDRKIYRIDPRQGGQVVEAVTADFETTGLAWDGRRLWNGVLVGTTEDHAEETPFTGFVQQRDLKTGAILRALPVQGVFAGGTDWQPGQAAQRMWWYDGYHERLIEFRIGQPSNGLWIAALVLAILNVIVGCLSWALSTPQPVPWKDSQPEPGRPRPASDPV